MAPLGRSSRQSDGDDRFKACGLKATDVDEVTISSTAIDGSRAKVSLKRDASFPFGKYGIAVGIAAVVALAAVLFAAVKAYGRWTPKGTDGSTMERVGAFARQPLDTPALPWSFKDSWLTNLTPPVGDQGESNPRRAPTAPRRHPDDQVPEG